MARKKKRPDEYELPPMKLFVTSHLWSPWMYAQDDDGSMKLVVEDEGETVIYSDVSKLWAPNKVVAHALIEEESASKKIVLLDPALRK